jgi:hypothetical protein
MTAAPVFLPVGEWTVIVGWETLLIYVRDLPATTLFPVAAVSARRQGAHQEPLPATGEFASVLVTVAKQEFALAAWQTKTQHKEKASQALSQSKHLHSK